MERLESTIVGCCIGVIVPLCCFVAAWWGSVGIMPERAVVACAVGGLGVGVVLNVLFLKRWVRRVYTFDRRFLMLLYVYVSIIVYAVSMGVPIPLLLLGGAAGVYAGRRARVSGVTTADHARAIRGVSLFTAFVIGCASVASGLLALRQQSMGLELQRIFNLRFEVTRSMISGLVVVGGAVLIILQYALTKRAAIVASGVPRNG